MKDFCHSVKEISSMGFRSQAFPAGLHKQSIGSTLDMGHGVHFGQPPYLGACQNDGPVLGSLV